MRKWKNFAFVLLCAFGAYSLLFQDFSTLLTSKTSSSSSLWQQSREEEPKKDTVTSNAQY